MKILITAAATAVAYKIERLLNTTNAVVFGDSVELPQILVKDKNFVKIPSGESASFAHLLLSLCLDLNIVKIYPLRRAEVLALAEARQLFDEYGINVIVPDKSAMETLLKKEPEISGTIVIREDSASAEVQEKGVFYLNELTSYTHLVTVD